MRLHLISPTHYQRTGALVKTTRYWTSGLTLPTLKALTPREWDVRLTDELIEDVDLDHPCDVVGITAMGPQIARAYDLADRLRARGRKVVLGGSWVSLAPLERSLAHADAVVLGEAERVWATVLGDLAAGRAKQVYQATDVVDLCDLPVVDYRDLKLVRWTRFRVSPVYRQYFHWPVLFSRGCPHPCSFCAVQALFQRQFRTRPVEDVLDDVRRIKALGGRKLLFLDDNPIARPEAAKELFRALVGEKIIWTSQCPITIAHDPELLDSAARSGCVSLSIWPREHRGRRPRDRPQALEPAGALRREHPGHPGPRHPGDRADDGGARRPDAGRLPSRPRLSATQPHPPSSSSPPPPTRARRFTRR